MSSSPDTVVVPWAVRGLGFRGAITIDRRWMPKQQWDGATVRDLMACVESRLDPEEGLVVVSMSLFGSYLKPDQELLPLLPALLDPFPCLLAITLQASEASMIEFTVNNITGRAVVLKCSRELTVLEVKRLVEQENGIPPEQQRLISNDRQLEDHYTLKQYGIQHGAVIPLVLRLRGGGGGGPSRFADVSNDSLLTAITFANTAPDWRCCGQGLNIEGRCENSACDAFGSMVIHPYRYESFNLIHERTSCPICYEMITPVTCGFYACEWTFQGIRASDGMRMSSPWKSADGDRYRRFSASETSGSIEWNSLLITVKPLSTFLPTAREPRSCSACADSLDSTDPEATHVATCGHRFHQSCCADLAATQLSLGVVCTCPTCSSLMETQ